MKKILLFWGIVAGCFIGQVNAQNHFGLKAGINFDNFKLKNASQLSIDNSTGWQAGVMLHFKLPIVGIGVQPEFLYTVHKGDIESGSSSKSNSISYFEIPLNVRWTLDLKLVRPYILAGPYFSYAVDFSGDSFNSSNIDKFDWGIGIGAGIELWRLQFGLRYSWGLQNVSKTSDFDLKNNVFTISVGFFLL